MFADAGFYFPFDNSDDAVLCCCWSSSYITRSRSGVRSENARQIAMAAGYTDVRNYKGSWLEWESKDYPVQ